MADVDMTDAPVTTVKKSGAAEGKGADGKKRFEVKKVRRLPLTTMLRADFVPVERRRPLGLGHCR